MMSLARAHLILLLQPTLTSIKMRLYALSWLLSHVNARGLLLRMNPGSSRTLAQELYLQTLQDIADSGDYQEHNQIMHILALHSQSEQAFTIASRMTPQELTSSYLTLGLR